MYYALYCRQTNREMATGLNCTSKKQVRLDLISYLTGQGDFTKKELKLLNAIPLDKMLSTFEFDLLKQKKKFVEEYW